MRYKSKQSGFSAVELLITLFIAAIFLITGFQLYAAIIKNGGDARMMASASSVVTDYIQRYKSTATNPCTVQTPLTNSSITVFGLSNVYITVAIQCPYSSGTYSQGTTPNTVSEIIATVQYGTPQQTVSNATYVSNPNSGLITNGLVLNLDAGSTDSYPGSGTTWTDLSGNGNNGTLVGGFGVNGLGYNSTNGGSLTFDGSDDYVNVNAGNGSSLNLTSGMTISAWVKKSRNGSFERLVFKDSNSTSQAWGLQYADTNIVQLVTNSDGSSSGNRWGNGVGTKTDFNWHNIVGTYNGTVGIIYIDGVLDKQGVLGSAGFDSGTLFTGNLTTSSNPLYIGRIKFNSLFYYTQSQIANIGIYNRALSPSEINQDYNALKSRYSL